jgi:hypothetical protein
MTRAASKRGDSFGNAIASSKAANTKGLYRTTQKLLYNAPTAPFGSAAAGFTANTAHPPFITYVIIKYDKFASKIRILTTW